MVPFLRILYATLTVLAMVNPLDSRDLLAVLDLHMILTAITILLSYKVQLQNNS